MSIDPRIISGPLAHQRGVATRIGDIQRAIADLKQQAGQVMGNFPTLSGPSRTQQLGMPSKAVLTANQSVAAGLVLVPLNSTSPSGVSFDIYGDWDVFLFFRYQVPASGFYLVNGAVGATTATATQTTIQAQIFHQGNIELKGSAPSISTNLATIASTVSGLLYCVANDYVDLRVSTSQNLTIIGTTSGADTFLSIMQVA